MATRKRLGKVHFEVYLGRPLTDKEFKLISDVVYKSLAAGTAKRFKKQQPLNARELEYLDSVKSSRGAIGGGWLYEKENFTDIIKGRFTPEDAAAVMRRLERIMRGLDKEEKANPAMAKRIAQKLRPFTEKLYYEGLIGRKITWNEQENIERVEERIRNLSCESG